MDLPDSDRSPSNFQSRLNSRLFDARTLVINEALTTQVAGQITERLSVLDAESAEPIHVVMSSVPGGDAEAGLSTYDVMGSLTAPVTILASGRIAGPGMLALVGAPSDCRFALPHARFRLREPTDTLEQGPSADLDARAAAAADRRDRIVVLLAEETGQTEDQIEADLSTQRAFEADEAAVYGFIQRVVQTRREIT